MSTMSVTFVLLLAAVVLVAAAAAAAMAQADITCCWFRDLCLLAECLEFYQAIDLG